MDFLIQIKDFLQGSAMAQVAIIGMVLDFILRLIKTDKPASILLLVAKFAEVIAEILKAFSALVGKVVPDRVKEQPTPPSQ